MATKKFIKCAYCGTFNIDTEYCKNCNNLISDEKKRALKLEKIKQEEINKVLYKKANPNFVNRLRKHPFFVYRIIGIILHSAFMVASIIGAGLAWFIAMIAAG